MTDFQFNGFDWTELADKWGIEIEERPLFENDSEITVPERAEIKMSINNTMMTFETEDEDEVLAQKIKTYIFKHISMPNGEFTNPEIRRDLEDFLKALIEESKQIDYNYPVYEGMLKIESDLVFAKWITENLETLWT